MPGIEGTGYLFEPLSAELPRGARIRVVRYPVRKDVSYEELLEIVMGEIDSSRPFVVLAESFSGPLAIELYERMGGNLKGMIFCSTFARSQSFSAFANAGCIAQRRVAISRRFGSGDI